MMGRQEARQGQFFYAFDLSKVVPSDHLVRQIDAALDLGWIHKELAHYCSHTGRPSVDPELMIRMLLVGYVFAIRSERQLCSEVRVNLAYRWFCRLGIKDKIPDHSVFCRARHERFRQSGALRRVFEGVVAMSIAAGLVGREAFSVDASLIKADVDKTNRVPGDQPIAWPKAEEASRAVREYLAALDSAQNHNDGGGEDGGNSHGDGKEGKPPKQVSLTDPQAASRWPSASPTARGRTIYIKRLDKDGKMVRIASLRPSSSCLENLFHLPPMSFSRIFRLSRSACVALAADALAPVVEGWFVILEVSGVGGRAIS
jgi:transposase